MSLPFESFRQATLCMRRLLKVVISVIYLGLGLFGARVWRYDHDQRNNHCGDICMNPEEREDHSYLW